MAVSPDGQYLYWLAPSGGVLNVWVALLDELERATPVTADKTRPVSKYMWTFDGKHLIYLQDTGGDENFRLFRAEVTTGDVAELVGVPGARVDIYALSSLEPNQVMIGINDRDKLEAEPKAGSAHDG